MKGKTGDGRAGSLYGLTPAGQRALQDWLGTLDEPTTISVPPDPLRNRIAFFASLDPESRRTQLAAAAAGLRAEITRVSEHTERLKAEHRTFEYLVSIGALRALETRLEWILEVNHLLETASHS